MDLPSYVRVEPPSGAPAEPAVSVVIPAYNEAERIVPYLEAIASFFRASGETHEVWVVNDGSADRTVATVRACMKRQEALGLVHYDRNRGKGHAVRMGMRAARGGVRLFADADGSTPIEEYAKLRARIEEDGFDLAVGSRALSAPGVERRIKPHRRFIGQLFRLLRQALLRVDVVDSQCGFKLFSARAAEMIFGAARVDGFAFDVELLYLAARWELRCAEVPVNWYDAQASRVNLLLDPFKMFWDMLRVRRLHRDTPRPEAPPG